MFMIDDAGNVQLPIQIWGHSLHQYTGKMLTSTVSLKNRSGETKQASYFPLEPSHKSFFSFLPWTFQGDLQQLTFLQLQLSGCKGATWVGSGESLWWGDALMQT